jgi:hypothetical protein
LNDIFVFISGEKTNNLNIPIDDHVVVGCPTDGCTAAGFAALSSPGGPDAAHVSV